MKSKENLKLILQNINQLYALNNTLETIINNIKNQFNKLIFKENKNRLFLKIEDYLLIIAKNNLGNFYNQYEYLCSNYFKEYIINFSSRSGYYWNHSHHFILKPFILKFNYELNSKNKDLFYNYSSSFCNKGITKNFNPKMIGLYNNKLVLRSYLNIVPYNNRIQCHNCGQPIYTYLEPYCPYCHITNFNDNNFINNLFKNNKGVY